jgi:hypothetical protein
MLLFNLISELLDFECLIPVYLSIEVKNLMVMFCSAGLKILGGHLRNLVPWKIFICPRITTLGMIVRLLLL